MFRRIRMYTKQHFWPKKIIFAKCSVCDQTVKIMCLKNLVLYGIVCYNYLEIEKSL